MLIHLLILSLIVTTSYGYPKSGAQGRTETGGYEDDIYASPKKSSGYYNKGEDDISYAEKKDDIYSGANKYEDNFEDAADPLYEDYSETTQSSLYGEDGYETINNFPMADAVKSEPSEANDRKIEFDPTQKNNKDDKIIDPITPDDILNHKKEENGKATKLKKSTDKVQNRMLPSVGGGEDLSSGGNMDDSSLDDETLQNILKDPDVIALIKENSDELEDVGDLESFLEESGILDDEENVDVKELITDAKSDSDPLTENSNDKSIENRKNPSNTDFVKEFKDKVKDKVYSILEEDHKANGKHFEPFNKESLYKKYAEKKVVDKIDKVLQDGEMEIMFKHKSDSPSLDIENKSGKKNKKKKGKEVTQFGFDQPPLEYEDDESGKYAEKEPVTKTIDEVDKERSKYPKNRRIDDQTKTHDDSSLEKLEKKEDENEDVFLGLDAEDDILLTSGELEHLTESKEDSVEKFEERNKYEDDHNKNRNYNENKDENLSKENTTPENENIDIYNNSAEDTDENENNLYKVVTIYKDFTELKFQAVHKACVARTDQDGIPKEDDTSFEKMYGLESDMYKSLLAYVNGDNKQNRKLKATNMLSMEENVFYYRKLTVRPNINGTVTRTLCIPIDRFNRKIPPEMENHLKVIALVLPNDPNIKLKEFQEVVKYSRLFQGVRNDYHFRYHANSLVNTIVDASKYENVDLHRYMVEYNTDKNDDNYMVAFILNQDKDKY